MRWTRSSSRAPVVEYPYRSNHRSQPVMNQDRIQQRCESMEVSELVRALTLEKDENSAKFCQLATQALEARGVELADFLDRVTVGLNDGEEESASRAEALIRLDLDLGLWDALVFVNCIGNAMVVQREVARWVVHAYTGESYSQSFFVDSRGALKDTVATFLHLEPVGPGVEGCRLDDWQVILESDSKQLVQNVTADLEAEAIPHTVQTPLFSGDDSGYLRVLVHPDELEAAFDVLDGSEETVEDLHERAVELAATGDRKLELELYDSLTAEDPENPAVFYNRGSVLIELGRYDEAVDSLCEAVAIGLKSVEKQVEVSGEGAGLGGLFGLVALLLRPRIQPGGETEKRQARYPDYIDDAEMLLGDLEQRLPHNVKLLHGLASIARMKNNAAAAETLYRRILELDPDDRVAYFNLGYLHSESGGKREGNGETASR